jgi:hypothetical protein
MSGFFSRSRHGETAARQLAAYGVLFRDHLRDRLSHIRFQLSRYGLIRIDAADNTLLELRDLMR